MQSISNNKMTSERALVTPMLARQWLKTNIENNRSIRRSDVESYKQMIKAGRFTLTPEGISFNTAGKLIDGQHRLTAISEGVHAVWMIVWRNVPDSVMAHLNTGRQRSLADVITVTKTVGADIPARHMVTRASVIYDLHNPATRMLKQTVQQYEWVKEHYLDSIVWVGKNYPGGAGGNLGTLARKIRSAPVMGAIALAHKKNPVEIEAFTRRLDTGLELTDSDPAYALRRFIDGAGMGGVSRLQYAYATLRAAYAAAHKRRLSVIKGSTIKPENPEFGTILNYFGIKP